MTKAKIIDTILSSVLVCGSAESLKKAIESTKKAEITQAYKMWIKDKEQGKKALIKALNIVVME